MSCFFFDDAVQSKLKNKRVLSKYICESIFLEIQIPAQLQYVFVTDEALLTMNEQFLQHNTFTDIITFNLSENSKKLIGEIYISVDRVTENASKFSTTYVHELHRVIFHGALHLCGYKDKSHKDKTIMRGMEDKWLSKYF